MLEFYLEFGNLHLSHSRSIVVDSFATYFFFPHKKTSPPLLCQESEELEEELDEARIFDTRGHHTFSKKTMFWDAVFFSFKLKIA